MKVIKRLLFIPIFILIMLIGLLMLIFIYPFTGIDKVNNIIDNMVAYFEDWMD